MELDSFTITDKDQDWDFRVVVKRDEYAGRPEQHADIFDPKTVRKMYKGDKSVTPGEVEAAVDWAWRAVAAWERDKWCFAVLSVTPVHKESGAVFEEAKAVLGMVEYGILPGTTAEDEPTDTADREYMMSAWLDDMIDTARDEADAQFRKIKEG